MPENKQDHKYEIIQSTPFTGEFQNIWENNTTNPLKDILEAQKYMKRREEIDKRNREIVAELIKSKFNK